MPYNHQTVLIFPGLEHRVVGKAVGGAPDVLTPGAGQILAASRADLALADRFLTGPGTVEGRTPILGASKNG
jgi:hypothetical protein